MSDQPPAGRNLLANRPVAAIMNSWLYPGVLQLITASVFVVIVFQLLVGPDLARENFGTALVWVLWWPLLPILLLLFGRFWCSICPFGSLSDMAQRVVGVERRVPRFLKRYGIWIIDATFILITWADHIWGIVESPWGSGVLLLMITTAVIVSGAFLQRRAFCRHLCFLGGVAGNYARSGMVKLRTKPHICATCKAGAPCFNGGEHAPACPLFEFPRTMDSSENCILCSNCIKNCPHDAITLTAHPPTKELWFIRNPKFAASFLAVVIMGIVIVQNVTMLNIWDGVLSWLQTATGTTNYTVNFTIAFAAGIAIPVTLLFAATLVAKHTNHSTLVQNFTRFGYALIPLDVAAHVAHNLFHLLAEGGTVLFTTGALFGLESGNASPAIVGPGVIQVLQYTLLALGVLGSVYTAYRIARNWYDTSGQTWPTLVPYAILVAILGLLNVVLFMSPMGMRM